ncbi:hypothetical protein CFT9_12401 [Pseudomonas sp. CFT9]|nr:hypothetical protein CFT9_12401 [Pseudomonas sp. CFT9]EPL13670.1 hypothetical protein CF150_02929 [Pseudomonas sp. CF150]
MLQRLPRQLTAKQTPALACIIGLRLKVASHLLLISAFEIQLSHHLYHGTCVQGLR